MKKALFFVKGKQTVEEATEAAKIRANGYRVVVTNGLMTKGFEDSCDAVFMMQPFEHVVKWCEKNDIECTVLGELKEEKQEEPKEEPKEEEKPVVKRGRKPKTSVDEESEEK